jgi:hypothetical protein
MVAARCVASGIGGFGVGCVTWSPPTRETKACRPKGSKYFSVGISLKATKRNGGGRGYIRRGGGGCIGLTGLPWTGVVTLLLGPGRAELLAKRGV